MPEHAEHHSLLERAADFYRSALSDSTPATQYLSAHHLLVSDLTDHFTIGYCDSRLSEILPTDPKIREELLEAGILDATGSEILEGCLVLPVTDAEGAVKGLWGINPETGKPVVPKTGPALWNLPAAVHNAALLVAPDPIAGMSLFHVGYPNVCALVRPQLTAADRTALSDGASTKLILLTEAPTDPFLKSLPKSMQCAIKRTSEDINRLLVENGPEQLAQHIDVLPETDLPNPNRPLAVTPGSSDSFAIMLGARCYQVRGLEKGKRRLKATVRIEHSGKLHVDTVDLYSARARAGLAKDLARLLSGPAVTINNDISKLIAACEAYEGNDSKEDEPAVTMSDTDRREALAFGKSPDLLEQIITDFETWGLVGEDANKLLCYLAAVSRKAHEPLSVLILSSSGAGKTTLQDATLAFCPPEDVVKLTSLSGKALFYKGRTSLKHKILALEEGIGAEDASYAIRNLISSGELIIEATVKDLGTGKLTTMENRVEGPTAVFITTTDPDVDPETRSRFFVTSVDESRAQTRAILAFQRKKHTHAGFRGVTARQALLRKHHNFQRLLKPYVVVNTHAEKLAYSDDRLQSRRDQPKYLNLIAAMAFVCQMQKKPKKLKTGEEYIEVAKQDIELATQLACEIFGKSLDDLNAVSRDLLILLDELVEKRSAEIRDKNADNIPARTDITFTRRDIREYTGWPHARVERYLKQLVDQEYVLIDSGQRGRLYRYYLAYEGQGKSGDRFLLGLGSS